MSSQPVIAYVALGANLGDRERNIRAAIDAISDTSGISVVQVSSLIENPAIGGPVDSPPFLNGAAEVSTTLLPPALLRRLLGIEMDLGRARRQKWEPRIIDLDILLYGDLIIDTDELKVPHPLMHERKFVLEPLSQIAPEAIHPVFKRSVRELLTSA